MKTMLTLLAVTATLGCFAPSSRKAEPSSPAELKSRLDSPAVITVFNQVSFQQALNSVQREGVPMVIHNIILDRQVDISLPKGTLRRKLLDEICRQADLSLRPWETVVTVTKRK